MSMLESPRPRVLILHIVRRSCAGLRHDDMHDPVSASSRGSSSLLNPSKHASDQDAAQLPMGPESPSHSPLAGPDKSSTRGGSSGGLKRTSSCPGKLKDPACIMLVNPEYSMRNHQNFLDIYELGAVLGTGGYAVVRECTNIATGEKFAAKMMTVSEHPEAGGREIAKQERCSTLPCF